MNIKIDEVSLKFSKVALERILIDIVDTISEAGKHISADVNIEQTISYLEVYIKERGYLVPIERDIKLDTRYQGYLKGYGFSVDKYFIAYDTDGDYEPDGYEEIYYNRCSSLSYVILYRRLK